MRSKLNTRMGAKRDRAIDQEKAATVVIISKLSEPSGSAVGSCGPKFESRRGENRGSQTMKAAGLVLQQLNNSKGTPTVHKFGSNGKDSTDRSAEGGGLPVDKSKCRRFIHYCFQVSTNVKRIIKPA